MSYRNEMNKRESDTIELEDLHCGVAPCGSGDNVIVIVLAIIV